MGEQGDLNRVSKIQQSAHYSTLTVFDLVGKYYLFIFKSFYQLFAIRSQVTIDSTIIKTNKNI